jgi:FkbM family methyltransferase
MLVRRNRRATVFRLAASLSEKYLRAYYNESFFDIDCNGERFVISEFGRWFTEPAVRAWDVGAHEGEWARALHATLPRAEITSFEIIPDVADRLTLILPQQGSFRVERFGLSDRSGQVEVVWNQDHDTCNAINPRLPNHLFTSASLARVRCTVRTIDDYLAEGHAAPHVLKIGTEGHESAILHGAVGLLAGQCAPRMIQFEYGDTWIPSGRTLAEVHGRLSAAGYWVGRLYPNYVEFKEYGHEDEHYRMGNMIAVRDRSLRDALAR